MPMTPNKYVKNSTTGMNLSVWCKHFASGRWCAWEYMPSGLALSRIEEEYVAEQLAIMTHYNVTIQPYIFIGHGNIQYRLRLRTKKTTVVFNRRGGYVETPIRP